jgi:hypothetical protein
MLNVRFNGDLFPGKAKNAKQRELEWRTEMDKVTPDHLSLLANFVDGTLQIPSGQQSLWPLYSFDVIPLEFISSIYEEFVRRANDDDNGTHYTPSFLVDIVLDTCLPWNGKEWNVKVLDPACGSGIFLVKAFQRLVHRWRLRNKSRAPGTRLLRKLLTKNLLGVDIEKEAVRVASFSLYLAMCDEMEPRYIWNRVKFPRLRESRLIVADFFREDCDGFNTLRDREKYDIVVGNAPWGAGSAKNSKHGKDWAKKNQWKISNEDFGPLFLAKGAKLAKLHGHVSMLQSSGILFKTRGTAKSFRERLFGRHRVEQVINLSALRFGLFKEAVGPACVICLRPSPADNDLPMTYTSPKPVRSPDDDFRIVFDAYDCHAVYANEVLEDPRIWTVLMWGGPRDYSLIKRLSKCPSIEKLEAGRVVRTRRGIVRGNRLKRREEILDRPLLDADDFPSHNFPFLDAATLPKNADPFIDRDASTLWNAFESPQLILKLSWLSSDKRFRSRIVKGEGILSSQSYVSVHFEPKAVEKMNGACLVYNSKMAAYFMLLTSSHLATYRQKVQADELLRIPLPNLPVALDGVATPTHADERMRDAFQLKPAEWTLIDDAFDFTLSAFNSDDHSITDTSMLQQYGEMFARVLRSGFGKEKRIRITVFQTPSVLESLVQLVAVHLDWPGDDQGVHLHEAQEEEILKRILQISRTIDQYSADQVTIRRRSFHHYEMAEHSKKRLLTVYLCKPNLQRYWTRSIAMRDADIVSADLLRFAAMKPPSRRSKK